MTPKSRSGLYFQRLAALTGYALRKRYGQVVTLLGQPLRRMIFGTQEATGIGWRRHSL